MIRVNAIPLENLTTFLHKIAAPQAIGALIQKQQDEEEQRRLQWKKEREETQKKEEQTRRNSAHIFEKLESISTKVEKSTELGKYITVRVSQDKITFEAIFVYELKGKKKPRHSRQYFYDFDELMEHEFQPKWNDAIFAGRITGYKLK